MRDGSEPLSPVGVAEAEALADLLSDEVIEVVLSSPLTRALETAAHVGARHGLEPLTDRRLVEIDMGDWAGRPISWAMQQPEWTSFQTERGRFAFPNGESFVSLVERTRPLVDDVVRRFEGATVVLVAHLGNVLAIHAVLTGDPISGLEIPTGSVTDLSVMDDEIRVGVIGRRPG